WPTSPITGPPASSTPCPRMRSAARALVPTDAQAASRTASTCRETASSTNRFRPPAELAAALNGGGVRADQPVIAYRGAGISATVDLFALWLTGRDDAALYDGSLTEWSANPDLPLITG